MGPSRGPKGPEMTKNDHILTFPIDPEMLKMGKNDQDFIILTFFFFFDNRVPSYLFSYPHLVQQI